MNLQVRAPSKGHVVFGLGVWGCRGWRVGSALVIHGTLTLSCRVEGLTIQGLG